MQPNVKQQNVYNDYDLAQDPTTHHLALVHIKYTYISHCEHGREMDNNNYNYRELGISTLTNCVQLCFECQSEGSATRSVGGFSRVQGL